MRNTFSLPLSKQRLRGWQISICAGFFLLWPLLLSAELPTESRQVATVPATPSSHWVWANDFVFKHMEAGQAYLIDGASGRYLGSLSTARSHLVLAYPKDYSEIYVAESHLARSTRGERTDVVVIYDPVTLSPVSEILIPPKRAESAATLHHVTLTEDDRFLLIYNFDPAQSVSVVDVKARKFVGEIETAGCALVYPSGPRRFHMLCADGTMLTVGLDDAGKVDGKHTSAKFFDPDDDFILEKAARFGDRWLFPSDEGNIYPVDVSGTEPRFEKPWPLVSPELDKESWRVGGGQPLAIHHESRRLFVLMHQGGADTSKHPGNEVWVYDLETKAHLQRIKLEGITSAIQVSQDDAPLMFTVFVGAPGLEVYNAKTGTHQRTVTELGASLTVLQTPVGP
jgi:methylamine dehydrogenase heavy chain